MTIEISDEAVEAAAAAIASKEPGCNIFPECVTRNFDVGCACRNDARAALEAALPHLREEK